MSDNMLSEDELDYLDEVLQTFGNESSILDVNELDGFMVAMLVAPEKVAFSRWYPAIWGGVDLVPELDSEDEAEQLEGLLLRMQDTLTKQLASGDDFSALFYEGEFEGETVTVVEEWCFGFLRGKAFADWPELPKAQLALLDKVALHGDEENFSRLEAMSISQHQDSVEDIEPAVVELYRWFHPA